MSGSPKRKSVEDSKKKLHKDQTKKSISFLPLVYFLSGIIVTSGIAGLYIYYQQPQIQVAQVIKSESSPSREYEPNPLSLWPGYKERKIEFLKEYGNLYGFNGTIDEIRRTQLGHITKEVYVDYTGSGLYQKKQLDKTRHEYETNGFGNPHSINPSSHHSTVIVDEIRELILKFFNADPDEYTVVFTQGTSAALKLVGETFPWTENSTYTYTRYNHNSVLGIREYAYDRGAPFTTTDLTLLKEEFEDLRNGKITKTGNDNDLHLFAYPATCNFSGIKFPLDLIEKFHNGSLGTRKGKYLVILDAAAFVPTSKLDLKKYKPDFVPISFYKMFGYPTGLGALIARTESLKLLKKKYFGGGTVSVSLPDERFIQWMPELSSHFEDGTIPFLSIAALRYGLEELTRLGMDNVKNHVWALTSYTYNQMRATRHANGEQLFEIYGDHYKKNKDEQGPVINFNIRGNDGRYIGFYDVSVLATQKRIHLRTGCSCNPGACYGLLNTPKELIKETVANIANNACGARLDIVDGYPIGSIRVSFGYLSTFEDADAVIQFFKNFLLNMDSQKFLDTMEALEEETRGEADAAQAKAVAKQIDKENRNKDTTETCTGDEKEKTKGDFSENEI